MQTKIEIVIIKKWTIKFLFWLENKNKVDKQKNFLLEKICSKNFDTIYYLIVKKYSHYIAKWRTVYSYCYIYIYNNIYIYVKIYILLISILLHFEKNKIIFKNIKTAKFSKHNIIKNFSIFFIIFYNFL